MTLWCQCNETDDAKVIEKLKKYTEEHGPLTEEKFKTFVASLYKQCRSGCKSPCIFNVQACVRRHMPQPREAVLCDA